MKRLMLLVILFGSCINSKKQNTAATAVEANESHEKGYKVYKIDSVNSYYLVYAKQQDSLFKIVSKKNNRPLCSAIQVGKSYGFVLNSSWPKEINLQKTKASTITMINVTCLGFDDHTKICLEKDSINDLYSTQNLSGLCFIK